MKDHEIALLVNRLRDIARDYHAAQQLREQIARVIVDPLRNLSIEAETLAHGKRLADARILDLESRLSEAMQRESALHIARDRQQEKYDMMASMLAQALPAADRYRYWVRYWSHSEDDAGQLPPEVEKRLDYMELDEAFDAAVRDQAEAFAKKFVLHRGEVQ